MMCLLSGQYPLTTTEFFNEWTSKLFIHALGQWRIIQHNTEHSGKFYWTGTINGNDDACYNFKAEGYLFLTDDSDMKFVKIWRFGKTEKHLADM